MADPDDLDGLKGDTRIVAEAKKRFGRCETWESQARKLWVEDQKFAHGDADNNFQWDSALRDYRIDSRKPTLTINKTRQHNLIIINDAKQNKPGVNIRPTGGNATYDAAQVFEGIARYIEYISNAEVAYDTATQHQVESGLGYWRIVTDYVSDDSFDQDIFIRRVKNPLTIYMDPDIKEFDGSDARFAFVFEDVPKDEFNRLYPEYQDDAGQSVLGAQDDGGWITEDYVRVAEYYRRSQKRDKLVAVTTPQGQQVVRLSALDDEAKALIALLKKEQPDAVVERTVLEDQIEWFKIAGDKIIDRRPWLGKYIPIVRVIGEETIIEGKLDRKGHTRYMKDPQRMYNYWSSEATAQVALQTKTPYIAPAEAIENLEEYWKSANIDEAAVLPFNEYTEDGRQLSRPQREQPPVMATAYVQGMQITQNEMMMASGQYQSQFGQNENATSGKAINERQRQGDTATYHFIDNLAVAIRFTGKILIDLIPKVYDTPRVVKILAKDGTEATVQIDPEAQQAAMTQEAVQEQEAAIIFNPNVGRYEVESDIGPGYATRRQEAFNAMTQIASQNQEFMSIAGDLLFRAADFPMADELAERWNRVVPPAVKGDAPPPEVEQLTQQVEQMGQALVALQAEMQDKSAEINIKGYDAETKRITAIGNSGPYVTAEDVQPLIFQTIMQMLQGGPPEGQQQPQAPQQPAAA